MEIKSFAELLYKKLWLIILVTFVTTLGAAALNLSKKVPVYKAKSTLYIMTKKYNMVNTDLEKNLSYDDIMVSKQMIMDYKELLKSRMVIGAAIKELDFQGLTVDYLAGAVSINNVNNTNILEISACDENPVKARDIVNTFARVFINKIKELTSEDNIGIVDLAGIPDSPINTSTKKYILFSLIGSLIASVSFIYILDQFDNTIKTPESIEDEFDLKVLGMIPMKDIK